LSTNRTVPVFSGAAGFVKRPRFFIVSHGNISPASFAEFDLNLIAAYNRIMSVSSPVAPMLPYPIAERSADIAEFCRRHSIRKLSLFGSFLSGQQRSDSDVDLLVEFDPSHVPGLIALGGMTNELSGILGRAVDLRTAQDLSRYFRDEVLATARMLHECC
jgi:hypothetical protein